MLDLFFVTFFLIFFFSLFRDRAWNKLWWWWWWWWWWFSPIRSSSDVPSPSSINLQSYTLQHLTQSPLFLRSAWPNRISLPFFDRQTDPLESQQFSDLNMKRRTAHPSKHTRPCSLYTKISWAKSHRRVSNDSSSILYISHFSVLMKFLYQLVLM